MREISTDCSSQSLIPFYRVASIVAIAIAGLVAVVSGWIYFSAAPFASGDSSDELVDKGIDALSRRQYTEAIDYADRAVTQSPTLASAWKLLSNSANRSGQFDRSIAALETYSRLRPDDAGKMAFGFGMAWMERDHPRPAIRAFQLAERMSVEVTTCLDNRTQIATVTGHNSESAYCIMELLKRNAYTKGHLILLNSRAPSFSIRERLNSVLRADPKFKSPLLAIAREELALNHIDTAERLLIEIADANPEDVESHGVLGELYAEYMPAKFIHWHHHLPIVAADDAVVWYARGKWLSDTGETESAIRCLHESIVREPERLSATILIGQLLKKLDHADLGNAFTDRARRMQNILDLNWRAVASESQHLILPMIDELEETGRLWEAYRWCETYEKEKLPNQDRIAAAKGRIQPQLSSELARTKSGSLPGGQFAWEQFPLPDWSTHSIAPPDLTKSMVAEKSTIRFEDRAVQVGINFRFVNSFSPENGRKVFESMGAGVGVLDFDRDNWPDLFFPQGSTSPSGTPDGPSDTLFRNQHGERFIDVTLSAGIHETSYSQGVAAGDYDNDGFQDLYIANFDRNCLYHNNGDGTFTNTTEAAGIKQSVWTASCAIADLNGDGMPELFDVNYVGGVDLLTKVCIDRHDRKNVCRPTFFDAVLDTVSENLGDGRFDEKQSEAGLDLPHGRGLGVIIADFNGDDRLDIFVANDMSANYLLINEQTNADPRLRFHDEAALRNVAVNKDGLVHAGMGVACADINRDNQPDLLVTNFAQESNTLYLSQPGGVYKDATLFAGLREPSFEQLGFGTQFLDADKDGYYDLVVMNGHISRFVGQPFQMKAQIFRGRDDGRFTELFANDAGRLFDDLRLGRALALLDWNRDGRTDFVATDLEAPVLIAVNQSESPHHSMRLRLVGTQSSRDAIGAKVKVVVAPADERFYQLMAGDGYQSSNERVIEISLGSTELISQIEIRWPSNQVSRRDNVLARGDWTIIEGREDWVLQCEP